MLLIINIKNINIKRSYIYEKMYNKRQIMKRKKIMKESKNKKIKDRWQEIMEC